MKPLKNMKIVQLETNQLKILEQYLDQLQMEITELGDIKYQTPQQTKELAQKQREASKVQEAIDLQRRYKRWKI